MVVVVGVRRVIVVILKRNDLCTCLASMPPYLRLLMKCYPSRLILAGGFIRACVAGEKIKDIDLFVSCKEDARKFINILKKDIDVIETGNAFTIPRIGEPNIQIIHRWVYSTPEKTIKSFDFTIAKAAIWYDGDEWCSVCDKYYYDDINNKRLVYCKPDRDEDCAGSFMRVIKFLKRGYDIDKDNLSQTLGRMMAGLDVPNNFDEDTWKSKVDVKIRNTY